jgi:hypothetical protein
LSRARRSALPVLLSLLGSLLAVAPAAAAQAPAGQSSLPGVRVPLLRSDAPAPAHFPRGTATFKARDGSRGSLLAAAAASTPLSTWSVTYDAGFDANPPAKAAFQAAVDIWAGIIASPVPIKVDASLADLGPLVLGSAGPDRFYRHASIGDGSSFYPSALAGALTGTDRDTNRPDIVAQFSSTQPDIYYGTDGAPPLHFVDFETVVLHELGHGLGFAGSATYDPSTGAGGFNDPVAVFDLFNANAAGAPLRSLPNGSAALGEALTNDQAYWNGASAKAHNGGVTPRLYAPPDWDDGSSIAHLDEDVYPQGNANSLMTPYLTEQEVVHHPGPITIGVFRDLGWDARLGDTTAPTLTAAAVSLFSLGTTVGLSFASADTGSGIANHDVRYRRAHYSSGFGSFAYPPGWQAKTPRAVTLAAAKGYTYCLSARSRDRAGNVSAWSERCTGVALDDRSLSASAGWTRAASGPAYAKTVTSTVKKGVSLTRTGVQARRLALVATTCKGCGTVGVYWNGTLVKTVSLNAATTTYRKVITVKDFGAARSGTLVIKTLNTGRTYVDGLAINRT